MKKILLSSFLLCLSVGFVSAQKTTQTEKIITYKTQDDLVTREEMTAIKKDALTRGKNHQEVSAIIDEEFKKLVAKKQADFLNAQNPVQAEQSLEKVEKATEKTKILSPAEKKGNEAKLAIMRAEYEKKRAEMLKDFSKKSSASATEKQQIIAENEAKLKKQYSMLFPAEK